MKKIILLFFLHLSNHQAMAWCNLSHFRWDCTLTMHLTPSSLAPSLVYCGNNYGYISRAEYDQLARYQRQNINFVLNNDGEYVTSPCLLGHR